MSKLPHGINKRPTGFEFSAGGVVREGASLLMVKVKNLEGQVVWTFPKGHIERGEKAQETALREVEEETGYRCQIDQPIERAQYWFQRDGRLIKKTVTWFLMKPLAKIGQPDAEEILEVCWVPLEEAKKLAKYKSDKKILSSLKPS
jgi:8-oxo-dGTP diphosphatase